MLSDELLLDRRALEGTLLVERQLVPARGAALVADVEHAGEAVEALCQLWGGAAHLLVPSGDSGVPPSGPWGALLELADVDCFRSFGASAELPRARRGFEWPVPLAEVIAAADRPRADIQTLRVPILDEGDPWRTAYLATVGVLPEAPNASELARFRYRPDFRYDELLPVVHEHVVGSPDDLLSRVDERSSITPLGLSLAELTVRATRPPMRFTEDWPETQARLPSQGPDIVVVYDPASIEDLCLLWTVRAAAGFRRGFPLGVPVSVDVAAVIRSWEPLACAQRAFVLEPCRAVVSTTVPYGDLVELATELGDAWSAEPYDRVLTPAPPPGRVSMDLATFRTGKALVSAWSERDVSGIGRGLGRAHGARVRFRPAHCILPPSPSLSARFLSDENYRHGAFETHAREPGEATEIRWPTGWAIVEAFARDRGLTAIESPAGKAALALIHRIGSLDEVSFLASPAVLGMLYRLSERSGMTWFKKQINVIRREVRDSASEQWDAIIASHLANLASAEAANPTHITLDGANSLGSPDDVQSWFRWAERAGVVIRGTAISCSQCGATAWRPAAEIVPPVTCNGCARVIPDPFPMKHLTFSYRASEPVLRACEVDSLGHALVLRWFAELFHSVLQSEPRDLVGVHPGVTFRDSSGRDIGEADLLLLFRDGTAAVGEYKRSGAGLVPSELEKLDRLADRLDASWTFVATHELATSCGSTWRECIRHKPERPRIALSGERLFGLAAGAGNLAALSWPDHSEYETERFTHPGNLASVVEWFEGRDDPDSDLREAWAHEDRTSMLEGD